MAPLRRPDFPGKSTDSAVPKVQILSRGLIMCLARRPTSPRGEDASRLRAIKSGKKPEDFLIAGAAASKANGGKKIKAKKSAKK